MTDQLPAPVPADVSDDDLDVEVLTPAEIEARGLFMKGVLAGQEIRIPPVKKWRSSALSAMKEGDFEHWAKVTLDAEGWDLWVDIDPTMEQIEALFESLSGQMGVSSGNSRASRRSSRRTARR